ncbi:hypothetical protein [Arthrobacter flavus]|uniref:Uncharacterized protein n=1 Tax=Arthrobacter flavus TaxID=95172 RepID=A0ABW4Q5J5_9MICC
MPHTEPSVASMKLSKDQYIELADTFRDKAQKAHHEAREWMARALVAEAQLSTLRAAYEPPQSPSTKTPPPMQESK